MMLTGLLLAANSVRGEGVVLAVPLSLQPYFIPVSDKGLAYETILAAFETQGLEVRPMFVSPKNYTQALARDPKIDCAGLLTEAEAEGWYAVDDIYAFHDYAATLSVNHIKLNEIRDLSDKKIIAFHRARNYLGPAFRDTVKDNPRYREILNHRASVQLLLRGRVDAIIADKLLIAWYLNYLAEETGSEPFGVTFHDLFSPQKRKFACRRQELIDRFATGLEVIRANGTLKAIRSAYLK